MNRGNSASASGGSSGAGFHSPQPGYFGGPQPPQPQPPTSSYNYPPSSAAAVSSGQYGPPMDFATSKYFGFQPQQFEGGSPVNEGAPAQSTGAPFYAAGGPLGSPGAARDLSSYSFGGYNGFNVGHNSGESGGSYFNENNNKQREEAAATLASEAKNSPEDSKDSSIPDLPESLPSELKQLQQQSSDDNPGSQPKVSPKGPLCSPDSPTSNQEYDSAHGFDQMGGPGPTASEAEYMRHHISMAGQNEGKFLLVLHQNDPFSIDITN